VYGFRLSPLSRLGRNDELKHSQRHQPDFAQARFALEARTARERLAGFDARSRDRVSMIRITPSISIGEDELEEHFIRASGPGGQNVNKLASAVQLRFDVRRSPDLPDDVRARLERLAGRRLTREGVLVINAQRHRTQERNREDARERLFDLIRRAAVAPRARRPTKPTAGARERRLESKKRRGTIKGLRRARPPLE
jgi:ribosome-associated protein